MSTGESESNGGWEMTLGVMECIVPSEQMASAEQDETLKALRRSVEMLVVVSADSYVPAMIAALGS